MREEQVIAKSKGQVVGEGTVTLFDNVQEAVDNLGAEKILALVNRQLKVDKTNAIREANTRKSGIPKVIREKLLSLPDDARAIVMQHMGITEEQLLG